MKIGEKSNMVGLVLWCILLLIGFNIANALSYDYTASIECLASPQKPQYNGGVIQNPELNEGLKGWSTFGDAKIEHRTLGNNKFIVANSRVHPHDSVSQNLNLEKNKIYTFSAWIQVSKGRIPVSAVFKTQTGYILAGSIFAESSCWSMLKGGFTVDASGSAQLYFESNNTSVDIWVDSISLQPFTEKQWMSHQDQAIEKWYSTEPSQGKVDYSVPDAMLQFAKKNNVLVRGHNVFWDDPKYQQGWINSLSPADLSKATTDRINSIMSRYRGEVIGWDVVNENLHFNFFESKLGQNASAVFYNLAQKIDGTSTLFLNEYNTIENARDGDSTPAKYLQKLRDIKAFPGNGNLKLGIGLESHFSSAAPNLAYMRASIDTLAATNFPIWSQK
ncbi:hypothetical protein GH714_010499 [Hevea brasiliensis]|uniref:GH10 domain-containing protein n=1 Tax=Hevea brasiliensis TaxID=3981 RepID=A0A6A6L211_HEVBR|nr:hypothetical protein GH714_010499 [Hevea brasiliensis]